jgi:UDP-N-acetylenolpyruvoylglucosamine reductase
VVGLESPGIHHNREKEIDQEKYERSHYVIENTGSCFENELKTNSKYAPNARRKRGIRARNPTLRENELGLRSCKARQKQDKMSARED